MNNTRYPKFLILLIFTSPLLNGCYEEGVLSGNQDGTDKYSNIELKTQLTATTSIDGLYVGDSVASIAVKGSLTTSPGDFFLFRADSVGQTAISSVDNSQDVIDMSNDGSTLVQSTPTSGAIIIIDPVTATAQQIGTSFTFSMTPDGAQITDDGSTVAFISSADLTGGNPGTVNQIFTLPTDGSDIPTQVTSFTGSLIPNDSILALSGDGNTVFFSSSADVIEDGSNADGSNEVFSINADSTNLKRITNNIDTSNSIIEMESDETGSTIAVVIRTSANTGQLHSVSTSAGLSTSISNIESSGWDDITDQFDISSDGSTIYYVTYDSAVAGGDHHFYIVDSNGSNSTSLIALNYMLKAPHSSANGAEVTFISEGNFRKDIVDGSPRQVYTLTAPATP